MQTKVDGKLNNFDNLYNQGTKSIAPKTVCPFEEQEMPNEMGNAVFLPLFSFIRSFIFVRFSARFCAVGDFFLSGSRAKHLSFAFSLRHSVSFAKDVIKIHISLAIRTQCTFTHRVTCGCLKRVIYIFFLFHVFVHFLLRLDTTYWERKKCCRFLLDGRLSAAKEQTSSWNTVIRKKTEYLVIGANRAILFYNWSVQFYSLHFAFGVCGKEASQRWTRVFLLNWSIECNKVMTKTKRSRQTNNQMELFRFVTKIGRHKCDGRGK